MNKLSSMQLEGIREYCRAIKKSSQANAECIFFPVKWSLGDSSLKLCSFICYWWCIFSKKLWELIYTDTSNSPLALNILYFPLNWMEMLPRHWLQIKELSQISKLLNIWYVRHQKWMKETLIVLMVVVHWFQIQDSGNGNL